MEIDAKVLDTKDRKALGDESFAVPGKKKLPIHDAAHVRNALARFNQTQGLTPAERKTALARIHRAAKKFGISVKAEAADFPDEEPDEITAVSMTLVIEARSLDLPKTTHPNKMPFTGVLTRVDVASDKPPNGSGGKRILVTRAAAEEALDSLLGMGVDLTKGLDGHNAQNKVGVITGAHIDGDAVNIEGFIYASDFPREALRIHLEQADLGFSFEARDLAVESMEADPLVVKRLSFTGAAILMKSDAAYTMTSLAAANARLSELTATEGATDVSEISEAVTAAITAALGPLNTTLGELKAAQVAQGTIIDEIKNAPTGIHAVSAAVAKVEPHAASLEGVADKMEAAGIGCAQASGHVSHLRRMAASMRSAAHQGSIPSSYHDSGSYWASADPEPRQQQTSAAAAPVKIEDSPQFKALQAELDKTVKALAASADKSASLETKIADLTKTVGGMRPAPERKTVTPQIASILARAGLTAPEEEGGTIPIGKIDAALAGMPGMDLGQRMHLKTMLSKSGIIAPNGS